jgi:hypothetical protein
MTLHIRRKTPPGPVGRPRVPGRPDRRWTQVGVRLPNDLTAAMDRFCEAKRVLRSEVVVAALRAHLNCPAPASVPADETPT